MTGNSFVRWNCQALARLVVLVPKKEEKVSYYSFTNYVTPGTIYKYDIEKGTSEVYNKPDIDFNSEDYTSEQVFYESKDGTKIPMIITYKKRHAAGREESNDSLRLWRFQH